MASRRGQKRRHRALERERLRRRWETCFVCGRHAQGGFITRRGERVCAHVEGCTERVLNPPPEPPLPRGARYEYGMGHIQITPDFSGFDGAIKGAFQQLSSSSQQAAMQTAAMGRLFEGVGEKLADFKLPEGFTDLGWLSDEGIER